MTPTRDGTVAYMSPEQARGLRVDHRTDIFSFGVVLYEMLSGVPPFRRVTPGDTLNAILHDEPAELPRNDPAVPALERIVFHCLEKKARRTISEFPGPFLPSREPAADDQRESLGVSGCAARDEG